ncbi:MAG: Asp-tRNA(Asn)/Glu-tRNA(Gln) amidotransferase subunit GatC [Patescibacteria group bacterium]|nr:Asp-tRNA(Asn)/Glu-tRNA(Gln) amidotransferase subunit GatC [Patescibacteria group bacterium]MDD5121106.1 Asp-tRNA(Asn)/Glu-tRNA(Gln) amidotransferase subunit GatC [Patescibacteria group bacterium]MDD5221922.1 Asp-tRNA(Asn)/Glu-tRNA(Gln) amidotransferase subunit GatC [Patescibacteria group bacterium]MDD5395975.1 Asp-tRNA(Asn)/Glu-tRNA(Gln) amidotransferase subunit GatC [Patescibacteria group bacterium]
MLNQEQIKHLAKLARLDLTEAELLKYQKQISDVLEFVGQLQKIDAANSKERLVKNIAPLREDIGEIRSDEDQENLLNQASLREGKFIKTKGVFE